MQLIERLAQHARNKPDAPAYIDSGLSRSISWKDLHDRAIELSKKLKPGSVVLIRTQNSCDFPIAFLAALAAGATVFPLSIETPKLELDSVAQQTGAAILVESAEITSLSLSSDNPRNGGLMLLSSGSTGKPKIICRSIESLDVVSNQMCQSIGIGEEDRVLATVPLCHSYGLEHGLLAPIWAGATVHLIRGLDLQLVQRELLQSRITLLPAVPSAFEMLGNLSAQGDRFKSLRAAYSAGAPLPSAVAEKFHHRCGIRIGQVFGATEIGSVTYSNPRESTFNPASVGQPMPGVKISIRDSLLHIAAASMFSGYLHEPDPKTADGYYPTGDLAELDPHGNLVITGRANLLIDIGGLKVNPIEVEQVLMQHPAVADCVVIPVQQSETVVRLKAILTLRPDQAKVTTEQLRQFARERLAGYKVPRSFEVRANLPRTETGKILRQMVKA